MNCHKLLLCERGVLLISTRSRAKSTFWSYILGRKTKAPRVNKSKRYAESLCLPNTAFPLSVKDGLAAKRELDIQRVRSL